MYLKNKSHETGLIGMILLFILVVIAGIALAYFIFFKRLPKITINSSPYKKASPAEIKKIHEDSFVEPGNPPQ